MSKECICASGIRGRQGRLRDNYTNLEDFTRYAEIYDLHSRLGFKTPATAWRANPVIQWSVKPSDFRRAPKT